MNDEQRQRRYERVRDAMMAWAEKTEGARLAESGRDDGRWQFVWAKVHREGHVAKVEFDNLPETMAPLVHGWLIPEMLDLIERIRTAMCETCWQKQGVGS